MQAILEVQQSDVSSETESIQCVDPILRAQSSRNLRLSATLAVEHVTPPAGDKDRINGMSIDNGHGDLLIAVEDEIMREKDEGEQTAEEATVAEVDHGMTGETGMSQETMQARELPLVIMGEQRENPQLPIQLVREDAFVGVVYDAMWKQLVVHQENEIPEDETMILKDESKILEDEKPEDEIMIQQDEGCAESHDKTQRETQEDDTIVVASEEAKNAMRAHLVLAASRALNVSGGGGKKYWTRNMTRQQQQRRA